MIQVHQVYMIIFQEFVKWYNQIISFFDPFKINLLLHKKKFMGYHKISLQILINHFDWS